MSEVEPLRLGLLGAARISGRAVIEPAHAIGARLVAVAARDRGRAEAYASEHGIERVVDDYQALIDDPEVEVVYNPLANAHHGPWNLRVIEAGKHVFSEKPFAANADEARRVREAAEAAGVHVVEAFHYRYHPLIERMIELATNGEIGDLQFVEARMLMPPPGAGDLRWDAAVAGGGLMDVGCYAVHALRTIGAALGGEPEIVRAIGGELPQCPGVDAWLDADVALPGGVPARLVSGMTHGVLDFSLRLVGSNGEAYAPAFIMPQADDRLIVTRGLDQEVEHVGTKSTYTYQLEALTALVRGGTPMITNADDAVETMAFIDALYTAAGMAPRSSADG